MDSQGNEAKTDGGTGPLFQANIAKMGTPKKWKKGKVIDQKFTFTLDYLRDPKPDEDLGVEAVYALTEGMDAMMEDMEIDLKNYDLALQIGSKEHFKESSNTGETWYIPADDYFHRLQMTQSMLGHIARVLNSGEFISSDRGFSASMTLLRRDVKGGKRSGYKPGERIWEEVVKELRCVHEIKNKDELCCGRAIVVMREHAKKKAGEKNCYENIRQDRGKNSQQLKEAKQLYTAAGVPEGSCGYEEIQKFQDYLGPMGYQLIVVDPVRGGVIFTGEQYKFAPKVIQIVKTYYEDSDGETKAHYDGVYSIAAVMNRSKFCRYCCKGYNTEDAKHHNCLHANCPSCMRRRNKTSKGCPDYTGWSKPTITCRKCCRSFYGEDCYRDHLVQKNKQEESKMEKDLIKEVALDNDLTIPPQKPLKSVCEMHRKCNTCLVSYKVKEGMTHKCGHGQCSNCLNYVDLYNHRCFIMSDIYKANKRYDNKQKVEEKILEAIKEMTTEDGEKVKDVAKNPITRKEQEEAYLKEHPPTQPVDEKSRHESIERVKKQLQDLGVDVTEIPEDQLEKFQGDHYMLTEGKKDKHRELVFADIECSIDNNRQFTPNLICFERETSDKKYHCWGRTCLRDFHNKLMTALQEIEKENNLRWNQVEMQVYFHNFRGFDGMFIIKQLYDMNIKVSKVLMTGQKILYFECSRLKFKDSMSFLNMPLESFTKTFGLTELKKGYFPHSFNKKENQNYEGLIPDLKYYETNCMNTKKKEAVEKWHGQEVLKGESWNFKKELLEYCESDVKLLKEGCLAFAADFEKECKFNPLKENITIASACHNFWRNNQMIPYSIAVEPPHGWSGIKPAQSKIGFQWLHIQDQKLGGNRIKHAANGGEQTLMIESWGKVRVDGYDPLKKTVYEFQGCEFHGCPKCKKQRHVKTWHHPDRTVDEMLELTKKKTDVLRKAGYTVKVEWECNFKQKLAADPELQDMIKDLEWTAPLNPKEALFGGRTGLSCCYHKTVPDERIDYVDYTSLYPWVNKYGTYPIGHPTIMKNPSDQNIDNYFGIAKVDVLAPEKLFHPVLPMKIGDKCMFTLCATCAQEQLEKPWHERSNLCKHTDQERQMTGTWCTEELKTAVERGYEILKIHEAWHWGENQRKRGLFAPYVNKFLKAKQEASGWPSDVETDEQKAKYVSEYEMHEGIQLEQDKIEINPGRKAVAKVMLNSFWGKFGEADNKPTTSTLQKLKTTIFNHFVRNSKVKSIYLEHMVKIFQVNWDKRVVEKTTGLTYPYGYVRL
ncbi:unnamed protein product [Porites lobata]|uniref:DNA-directed DNA polymerase n=1 Tax=Porites lobata TaxID=104759 RepID=A0ABN8RJ24_9CNID|nr:unnamed protein product [Porites lobata]